MMLLRDDDIDVFESDLLRQDLYVADEAFFTGTATEIAPIRSIDRVQIGNGAVGPVTRRVQELYLGIARGELEDRHNWLTPV